MTDLTELREIVLLTGTREALPLTAFLQRHNPDLMVTHVETRAELICACHPPRQACRLVAFCTATIVPGDLLQGFSAGAYNFHPGPPSYPGRHPASFAIYEGATRFGATAHEMMPRVDCGPIIGVEWFDMPPRPHLLALEGLSLAASVHLFARLVPKLTTSAEPLPRIAQPWSGWTSRQRDFDTLSDLPLDIKADEFDRRVRAVDGSPHGTLSIRLHGRRFNIDSGGTPTP
jgi:methionyl-tRNA formyltransferase